MSLASLVWSLLSGETPHRVECSQGCIFRGFFVAPPYDDYGDEDDEYSDMVHELEYQMGDVSAEDAQLRAALCFWPEDM